MEKMPLRGGWLLKPTAHKGEAVFGLEIKTMRKQQLGADPRCHHSAQDQVVL